MIDDEIHDLIVIVIVMIDAIFRTLCMYYCVVKIF